MRLVNSIILVVSVLFGVIQAQTKMTDAEFEGLKGNVKSVTEEAEWLVVSSDGPSTKKRQRTFARLYDKAGNLKEFTNYGPETRKFILSSTVLRLTNTRASTYPVS